MPLSSRSNANIPLIQSDSTLDSQYKLAAQIAKSMGEAEFKAQMAALRAAGGGGRGGGRKAALGSKENPKGEYMIDPLTGESVWVPGSGKTLEANWANLQEARGRNILNADTELQDYFKDFADKPLAQKEKTISAARTELVPKLVKKTGLPASRVIELAMGDYANQFGKEKAEYEKTGPVGTFVDAAKIGGYRFLQGLAGLTDTAEEELVRSKKVQDYANEVTESNARLKDRERQQAAGMGIVDRLTESPLTEFAATLGEQGPELGANILGIVATGGLGAAATGIATGARAVRAAQLANAAVKGGQVLTKAERVAQTVGGAAGGAFASAGSVQADYVQRLLQDESLTDNDRIDAINKMKAANVALGLGTGAMIFPLGETAIKGAGKLVAKTTGRSLPFTGSTNLAKVYATAKKEGKEVTAEAITEALEKDAAAEAAMSRAGRYFKRGLPAAAVEVPAFGVTLNTAGNWSYGQGTGQDVDLTEGLGESVASSLMMAVPFGLMMGGHHGPHVKKKTGSAPETKEPVPDSDNPTATGPSDASKTIGDQIVGLLKPLAGSGVGAKDAEAAKNATRLDFDSLYRRTSRTAKFPLMEALNSMTPEQRDNIRAQLVKPENGGTDALGYAFDALVEQADKSKEEIKKWRTQQAAPKTPAPKQTGEPDPATSKGADAGDAGDGIDRTRRPDESDDEYASRMALAAARSDFDAAQAALTANPDDPVAKARVKTAAGALDSASKTYTAVLNGKSLSEAGRGPGRPKGSKNKPKEGAAPTEGEETAGLQEKKQDAGELPEDNQQKKGTLPKDRKQTTGELPADNPEGVSLGTTLSNGKAIRSTLGTLLRTGAVKRAGKKGKGSSSLMKQDAANAETVKRLKALGLSNDDMGTLRSFLSDVLAKAGGDLEKNMVGVCKLLFPTANKAYSKPYMNMVRALYNALSPEGLSASDAADVGSSTKEKSGTKAAGKKAGTAQKKAEAKAAAKNDKPDPNIKAHGEIQSDDGTTRVYADGYKLVNGKLFTPAGEPAMKASASGRKAQEKADTPQTPADKMKAALRQQATLEVGKVDEAVRNGAKPKDVVAEIAKKYGTSADKLHDAIDQKRKAAVDELAAASRAEPQDAAVTAAKLAAVADVYVDLMKLGRLYELNSGSVKDKKRKDSLKKTAKAYRNLAGRILSALREDRPPKERAKAQKVKIEGLSKAKTEQIDGMLTARKTALADYQKAVAAVTDAEKAAADAAAKLREVEGITEGPNGSEWPEGYDYEHPTPEAAAARQASQDAQAALTAARAAAADAHKAYRDTVVALREEAQKIAGKYDVSIYSSTGEIHPLRTLMDRVSEKASGLVAFVRNMNGRDRSTLTPQQVEAANAAPVQFRAMHNDLLTVAKLLEPDMPNAAAALRDYAAKMKEYFERSKFGEPFDRMTSRRRGRPRKLLALIGERIQAVKDRFRDLYAKFTAGRLVPTSYTDPKTGKVMAAHPLLYGIDKIESPRARKFCARVLQVMLDKKRWGLAPSQKGQRVVWGPEAGYYDAREKGKDDSRGITAKGNRSTDETVYRRLLQEIRWFAGSKDVTADDIAEARAFLMSRLSDQTLTTIPEEIEAVAVRDRTSNKIDKIQSGMKNAAVGWTGLLDGLKAVAKELGLPEPDIKIKPDTAKKLDDYASVVTSKKAKAEERAKAAADYADALDSVRQAVADVVDRLTVANDNRYIGAHAKVVRNNPTSRGDLLGWRQRAVMQNVVAILSMGKKAGVKFSKEQYAATMKRIDDNSAKVDAARAARAADDGPAVAYEDVRKSPDDATPTLSHMYGAQKEIALAYETALRNWAYGVADIGELLRVGAALDAELGSSYETNHAPSRDLRKLVLSHLREVLDGIVRQRVSDVDENGRIVARTGRTALEADIGERLVGVQRTIDNLAADPATKLSNADAELLVYHALNDYRTGTFSKTEAAARPVRLPDFLDMIFSRLVPGNDARSMRIRHYSDPKRKLNLRRLLSGRIPNLDGLRYRRGKGDFVEFHSLSGEKNARDFAMFDRNGDTSFVIGADGKAEILTEDQASNLSPDLVHLGFVVKGEDIASVWQRSRSDIYRMAEDAAERAQSTSLTVEERREARQLSGILKVIGDFRTELNRYNGVRDEVASLADRLRKLQRRYAKELSNGYYDGLVRAGQGREEGAAEGGAEADSREQAHAKAVAEGASPDGAEAAGADYSAAEVDGNDGAEAYYTAADQNPEGDAGTPESSGEGAVGGSGSERTADSDETRGLGERIAESEERTGGRGASVAAKLKRTLNAISRMWQQLLDNGVPPERAQAYAEWLFANANAFIRAYPDADVAKLFEQTNFLSQAQIDQLRKGDPVPTLVRKDGGIVGMMLAQSLHHMSENKFTAFNLSKYAGSASDAGWFGWGAYFFKNKAAFEMFLEYAGMSSYDIAPALDVVDASGGRLTLETPAYLQGEGYSLPMTYMPSMTSKVEDVLHSMQAEARVNYESVASSYDAALQLVGQIRAAFPEIAKAFDNPHTPGLNAYGTKQDAVKCNRLLYKTYEEVLERIRKRNGAATTHAERIDDAIAKLLFDDFHDFHKIAGLSDNQLLNEQIEYAGSLLYTCTHAMKLAGDDGYRWGQLLNHLDNDVNTIAGTGAEYRLNTRKLPRGHGHFYEYDGPEDHQLIRYRHLLSDQHDGVQKILRNYLASDPDARKSLEQWKKWAEDPDSRPDASEVGDFYFDFLPEPPKYPRTSKSPSTQKKWADFDKAVADIKRMSVDEWVETLTGGDIQRIVGYAEELAGRIPPEFYVSAHPWDTPPTVNGRAHAAALKLVEMGIPGNYHEDHSYQDQICYCIFDDSQLRHMKTYFQRVFANGKQGDVRAMFSFDEMKNMQYALFDPTDASSFVHESAHRSMTMLNWIAEETGSPQARADFNTLLMWAGFSKEEIESKAYLSKENEQRYIEAQEQVARGFEQYMSEGKAPTPELRSLFDRFKEWLRNIYESWRQYVGADLTPEVRRVYDRWLYSDAVADDPSRDILHSLADVPAGMRRHVAQWTLPTLLKNVPKTDVDPLESDVNLFHRKMNLLMAGDVDLSLLPDLDTDEGRRTFRYLMTPSLADAVVGMDAEGRAALAIQFKQRAADYSQHRISDLDQMRAKAYRLMADELEAKAHDDAYWADLNTKGEALATAKETTETRIKEDEQREARTIDQADMLLALVGHPEILADKQRGVVVGSTVDPTSEMRPWFEDPRLHLTEEQKDVIALLESGDDITPEDVERINKLVSTGKLSLKDGVAGRNVAEKQKLLDALLARKADLQKAYNAARTLNQKMTQGALWETNKEDIAAARKDLDAAQKEFASAGEILDDILGALNERIAGKDVTAFSKYEKQLAAETEKTMDSRTPQQKANDRLPLKKPDGSPADVPDVAGPRLSVLMDWAKEEAVGPRRKEYAAMLGNRNPHVTQVSLANTVVLLPWLRAFGLPYSEAEANLERAAIQYAKRKYPDDPAIQSWSETDAPAVTDVSKNALNEAAQAAEYEWRNFDKEKAKEENKVRPPTPPTMRALVKAAAKQDGEAFAELITRNRAETECR